MFFCSLPRMHLLRKWGMNFQESPLHHLWTAEHQPLWIYQVGSWKNTNATFTTCLFVVCVGEYAIYIYICNVYGDERVRFVSFMILWFMWTNGNSNRKFITQLHVWNIYLRTCAMNFRLSSIQKFSYIWNLTELYSKQTSSWLKEQ